MEAINFQLPIDRIGFSGLKFFFEVFFSSPFSAFVKPKLEVLPFFRQKLEADLNLKMETELETGSGS